MDYKAEYLRWVNKVTDVRLLSELKGMDEQRQEDAFYRELSFGTGGLRGVLGAGTNRMNIYVVARASQGLADYLTAKFKMPSVVIGYDTRIQSDEFAVTAASVFAANGINVQMWKEPLPVPMVSYAVRCLGASCGVMITASHNPSQYNGYKVYGEDGCQITTNAASEIYKKIQRLDMFADIRKIAFEEAISGKKVTYIKPSVYNEYIEEVKRLSVLYGDSVDRNTAIVYSPLNGTGLKPVTRVLDEIGFTNITVVEEQRHPDGNFPTCPFPNPEEPDAMQLGLEYCRKTGASLLVATDPDCDRCGIAVRDASGNYRLFSANETGILLLDFICSQRIKHKAMPEHPVFMKTIVTTDLAEKIAAYYGVRTINVLTGFKFIGEQIGLPENQENYIFGFEESFGFLSGSYVRDKDGVNAVMIICEMAAYYTARGISLEDKLSELYRKFGYCLTTLHSYRFEGSAGMKKMHSVMESFRKGVDCIAGEQVERTADYAKGIDGLPCADVIKLYTASFSIVIRPSGTEPKLKVYISVRTDDSDSAKRKETKIIHSLNEMLL